MSRMKKLLKEEKGSQMVEFILTMPLVWLLIIFSFDQFTILYNKQKALSAAYEAGRIASVQPNYGLAKFHAQQQGSEELEKGIGITDQEVRINLTGRWQKGNHFESRASVSFRLIASREPYQISESYKMMIENAED